MELKFITDENGNPVEVIVPIKDWRKIEKKMNPGKKKKQTTKTQEILDGLKRSVEAVRLHQKGKLKLKTAEQLLHEL